MKITKRPLWMYACVGATAYTLVHSLAAQQVRIPSVAVGQIVSEVLRAVVPPTDSLSRVSIAKRGVFFDQAQTMAAFGYPGSASPADLGVRLPVTFGTKKLLSDCDEWGAKPCKQLGWSAYVWIEPISITNSQAVVRAYVAWPERGATPFVKGVAPMGEASLAMFATEVYLVRSANGEWKFAKKGKMIVG